MFDFLMFRSFRNLLNSNDFAIYFSVKPPYSSTDCVNLRHFFYLLFDCSFCFLFCKEASSRPIVLLLEDTYTAGKA